MAISLGGCESGPSMADLAPKIPKLRAEVPESNHPDIPKDQYPNINNAPDRPSVMRTRKEIEEIEETLEGEGQTHVRQALDRITGKQSEATGTVSAAPPAEASSAEQTSGQPIQLTPAE